MRYIHNTLLENERIVYVTHPHWNIFIPSSIVFVLAVLIYGFGAELLPLNLSIFHFTPYEIIALCCGLYGAFHFLKAYIFFRTSEYGVTDKRIIMKTGWIERNSLELFLDKIEAVYVDQTIPGRLLGYGSVTIIGTGGSKDPFMNVPQPLHFRKVVQQEMDYAVKNSITDVT